MEARGLPGLASRPRPRPLMPHPLWPPAAPPHPTAAPAAADRGPARSPSLETEEEECERGSAPAPSVAAAAGAAPSPRYFTPPERPSPMFFRSPSPRSVYYDSVRSPKFFPDERPPSPLGDRRNSPRSPRTLPPHSPKVQSSSPKVLVRDKENYFTFDTDKQSPRSRRYRRHNSCETGLRSDGERSPDRADDVEPEREDVEQREPVITVTTPPRHRNLRNLTIDLSQRDERLERELREFEKLYAEPADRRRPRTPTLKVKAASLDSSEAGTSSPPRGKTLEPPANSVSVPSTPKRQPRRLLGKPCCPRPGLSLLRSQDEGAPTPVYKQTLSVSSTNLKTLPEGVPSDDFGPPDPARAREGLEARVDRSPGADETPARGRLLQRRGSNNSLTLTIQCAPTERRSLLERRGSNASLSLPADCGCCRLCERSASHCQLVAPQKPAPGFGSHGDLRTPPRVISTEPLSPASTSEDFRLYLANMHHLHTASSVLTRARLRDLDELFREGYSTVRCGRGGDSQEQECCSGRVGEVACCDYQKRLLRNLHQEFWDMPTNQQEKPIVSGSHSKNRYRGILPNEHSRVLLRPGAAGEPEGYINANYIKGYELTRNRYIATQGPLPNTVYDLWLMMQQHSATRRQKVVMLTNLVEDGRHKCELYFPLEPGEVMKLHNPEGAGGAGGDTFTLTTELVVPRKGYTVRKITAVFTVRGRHEQFKVQHYWFDHWPDHKCPEDVDALLGLCVAVLDEDDEHDHLVPPVVHCSAGVGRTGCLLAILNGVEQLRCERKADVLQLACSLRLARGGLLQTSEQYELVHRALCLYQRWHDC